MSAKPLPVDETVHRPNSSDIWARVISEYTIRRLKNELDKLSALSGLASRFLDRYSPGDHYLAGLWRSHLPLHLLWECDNVKQPLRPSKYQAPSWSPLSLIGKVLVMPPKRDQAVLLVDLITADTVKASTDMMGPVSEGNILLEYCGNLIELTQRSRNETDIDESGNLAGTSPTNSEFVLGIFGSTPVSFDGNSVSPSYDLSLDMGWPGEAASPLYLLPVSRSIDRNLDGEDWMSGYEVRGLVLQPVDARKSCYSRVGVMKAYGDVADLILQGLDDVVKRYGGDSHEDQDEKTLVQAGKNPQVHII